MLSIHLVHAKAQLKIFLTVTSEMQRCIEQQSPQVNCTREDRVSQYPYNSYYGDPQPPAYMIQPRTPTGSGVSKAGWILVFIACALSAIPLFGFLSWFIAGPIFFAVFILGIIATAQGSIANGVLLLLTSIIFGPLFVVMAPFISSALGIAGTGAAISSSMTAPPPHVVLMPGFQLQNRVPAPGAGSFSPPSFPARSSNSTTPQR